MRPASFPCLAFVYMVSIACGCFEDEANTENSDDKSDVSKSLPQATFEAIKSNKPDALADVVMTADDFVALLMLEAKARKVELPDEELNARASQAASSALRKAESSLAKLRKTTADTGFNWDDAALASAATGDKPYNPKSNAVHLDIYLTIKSGDASIIVKLDDCFLVNGHRRIADGFRLQRGR